PWSKAPGASSVITKNYVPKHRYSDCRKQPTSLLTFRKWRGIMSCPAQIVKTHAYGRVFTPPQPELGIIITYLPWRRAVPLPHPPFWLASRQTWRWLARERGAASCLCDKRPRRSARESYCPEFP